MVVALAYRSAVALVAAALSSATLLLVFDLLSCSTLSTLSRRSEVIWSDDAYS